MTDNFEFQENRLERFFDNPVFDLVLGFFEDVLGFAVQSDPVKGVVKGLLDGNPFWCVVRPRSEIVGFKSVLPFVIPEDTLPQVVEGVARINRQLLVGNLGVDFENLRVLCGTGGDVEHFQHDINNWMHSTVMGPNVAIVAHYTPILAAIAYGGASPEIVDSEDQLDAN